MKNKITVYKIHGLEELEQRLAEADEASYTEHDDRIDFICVVNRNEKIL